MSSDKRGLKEIQILLKDPEFEKTFADWSEICKDVSYSERRTLFQLINCFPQKSWDWEHILNFYSYNVLESLMFNTVVTVGSSHPELNFPWDSFTYRFREYYKLEEFIKTKHLPWDWKELSYSVINEIDLVKSNLDLSWDWVEISSKVTHISQFDIVKSNVDLPWDWNVLSENMNNQIIGKIVPLDDLPAGYFTIDNFNKFLENYFDLPWNWEILTRRLSKIKLRKINDKKLG